jgi:hypothetical protein
VDPSLERQLRAAGIPKHLWAGITLNGMPIGDVPAEKPKPTDRYRSKTERLYADKLAWDIKDGVIARWEYEPLKFRLGDGAWYTPDFAVWTPGGLDLIEIKGGFVREAARVRFLVAKRLYPEFTWRMIQRKLSGAWLEIL